MSATDTVTDLIAYLNTLDPNEAVVWQVYTHNDLTSMFGDRFSVKRESMTSIALDFLEYAHEAIESAVEGNSEYQE